MKQPVGDILNYVQMRCHELFDVLESWNEPPVDEATMQTQLPHAEWIPASVWEYARAMNGLGLEWVAETDDSDDLGASGVIQLLPMEAIYRLHDWEAEIDSADRSLERLRKFRPVDTYGETSLVGLFHDEAQDPGLYIFSRGEGLLPYPLGIDILGYIRLLKHTLGYSGWPLALVALLPTDDRNSAYRSNAHFTAEFRQQMTALVPEFDYEAFLACYDEVKIKNYTPSLEY
jgi:hypothetical protein